MHGTDLLNGTKISSSVNAYWITCKIYALGSAYRSRTKNETNETRVGYFPSNPSI